jgi:hypothetical protein
MKFRLWLLFIVINSFVINAQISIVPLFNFPLFTCCHYAKHSDKTFYFRKQIGGTRGIGSGNPGIFIKVLPLTSKISLYTGIYGGDLSWGYWIKTSNDVFPFSSGTLIYHFPVFINLFDRKIGHDKQEDDIDNTANDDDDDPMTKIYNDIINTYSLHLKSYLGFSFDYVPPIDSAYSSLNYGLSSGVNNTGINNYSEQVHRISNMGSSIMMGESIYIYNNAKHKETFSLSILYFQGLLNLAGIDVKYKIDNTNYLSKLFSRGSSIDFMLAYNININYKDRKLNSKKAKYNPHTKYPDF